MTIGKSVQTPATRRVLRGAAGLAVIAILTAACTTPPAASSSSTPAGHGVGAVASAPAAAEGVAQPAHVGSYDEGAFSVVETIMNLTGSTLVFDPTYSAVDGGSGHWGTRPLATLAPGASETVSGYSDDVMGNALDVTYTLPNGEFAFFQAFVPLVGGNTTTVGVYGQMDSSTNQPVDSTLDASYLASGSIGHGVHPTATLAIIQASPINPGNA